MLRTLTRAVLSGATVVGALLPVLFSTATVPAVATSAPSSPAALEVGSCIGTKWRTADGGVSLGAIRWDAWFRDSMYERFLDPEQWRARLPFYGLILSPSRVQVRSDSGVTMDEEIGYAAAGGLTYWAFNYYHPQAFPTAASFNYGLNLYLSSPCRDEINFSLVLQGNWLGPLDQWPATVSTFVSLFQNAGYQQVAGGRPLLYFFDIEFMQERFGSWAGARAAVDALRAAAQDAGLADPYIVGLANPPDRAAELAEVLGLDAIGAYSAIDTGTHGDRPFEELRRANEAFWAAAAATGKPVVPPVSTGWDPRPRVAGLHGHEPAPPVMWFRAPTAGELAGHVQRAIAWTENEAAAGPRTVLMYAWNEHDEGGWLTPTLGEGTSRLDAIRSALRTLPPAPARVP